MRRTVGGLDDFDASSNSDDLSGFHAMVSLTLSKILCLKQLKLCGTTPAIEGVSES
jgi:hypothetical protein